MDITQFKQGITYDRKEYNVKEKIKMKEYNVKEYNVKEIDIGFANEKIQIISDETGLSKYESFILLQENCNDIISVIGKYK